MIAVKNTYFWSSQWILSKSNLKVYWSHYSCIVWLIEIHCARAKKTPSKSGQKLVLRELGDFTNLLKKGHDLSIPYVREVMFQSI